ncbi:ABC transporter permease [Microbacterium pseudoresistens]|uniref:Simple sugar transport system permease protein n=1 Tax=Microbacterium pseudoresistens TaxID=640634 RepID=A0A7Y9EVR0_9MICO|nr:ABC transporter permease [Microbacterium pseudoresistens]NYD54837.1 simple sugar transport system permease protein [Microbacterium pseudoresistens]
MSATATTTEDLERAPEPSRWNVALREISQSNGLVILLAVVLSFVIGGIMIAATDKGVQQAAGYFFARPTDTLGAIWDAVAGAYTALFRGSIFNYEAATFERAIRPFTETLTFATPLIAAGLGVALAFRIGMFNIGGRGQMLVAASAAGWVGFAVDLPWGLHMLIALVVGIAAGAIWGGIVGLLKAKTGAHEVIVTIMLNYVAYYLVSWMLRTPGLLQAPGSSNPKSPAMKETAVFPPLLGDRFNLNAGFILVILATVLVWWILSRSSLGFRFRAVGENPHAARTAGIDVNRMYIVGMLLAGGLVGLAGVNQVLGASTTGVTSGVDAGIGFDAITVALLGRSTPWGTFAAGLLFGALKAGSFTMKAAEQIPLEIVTVVQSFIVLFIAAPPLVRAIFFLPSPERTRRREARRRKKQLRADVIAATEEAAR